MPLFIEAILWKYVFFKYTLFSHTLRECCQCCIHLKVCISFVVMAAVACPLPMFICTLHRLYESPQHFFNCAVAIDRIWISRTFCYAMSHALKHYIVHSFIYVFVVYTSLSNVTNDLFFIFIGYSKPSIERMSVHGSDG